jgi:hypothetical protein
MQCMRRSIDQWLADQSLATIALVATHQVRA